VPEEHCKNSDRDYTKDIQRARRKGVLTMLTSNEILAAASFSVGTAPSKTSAHRQATFPLSASDTECPLEIASSRASESESNIGM
jgi:hypothetical protein